MLLLLYTVVLMVLVLVSIGSVLVLTCFHLLLGQRKGIGGVFRAVSVVRQRPSFIVFFAMLKHCDNESYSEVCNC